MKKEQAEEYTQSLGQIVSGGWRQIALAKELGVPKALGLAVEDWVNKRLGGYIKYSIAERREAVQELAAEGKSQRDIAGVLGVDHKTVGSDLRSGENSPDNGQAASELNADDEDSGENSPPSMPMTIEGMATDITNPLDTVTALAADAQLRLEAERVVKREQNAAQRRETDAQTVVVPEGKYACVVIDPPWAMEKIERDVRPNQVGFEYPTMTEDELINFPIDRVAADDCHIFCWTTQKFLPTALYLLESWEFRYVCTFVWHKSGGFQPHNLPQYNCEFVVYGRAGTPKFVDTKAFSTCFEAPRREHSRKPDKFYEMVRRVTDGPRVDIFSRESRAGFEQYGNEIGKFAAE